MACYRRERKVLEAQVMEPFKRYRDDLVVYWVGPLGLPFETQRHVFSRLPKNDFGAGGVKDHVWMAFYRPSRTRLTDVQLLHVLHPDGFAWGLFVGKRAGALFDEAVGRLLEYPDEALVLLNPLLASGYRLRVRRSGSASRADVVAEAPLRDVPPELVRAAAIDLRIAIPREDVLGWGPELVVRGIEEMHRLGPLYRWLLGGRIG